MSGEPIWLEADEVLDFHDRAIAAYGGATGVRDAGLLEGALARPQQKFTYGGETDIASLAASYAFGIAKAHPFVDGNKRTAFSACAIFGGFNGVAITAAHDEIVEAVVSLAEDHITEDQFADWLRANTAPRT